MNGHRYFVEPIAEHVPNKRGQLLHMVYERSQNYSGGPHCGTEQRWQDAWRDRFRKSLKDKLEDEDVDEDEKAEAKRGLESVHRYLETLVVADKKFLEHHKDTDHELYIMTIMNMVSDYYHDSSSGNQMDVVVVRIMYLEKEEEEIDLVINQDAEKTLASFCDWQQRINPKDIKNPNHHDIAILLTRHDICADNMANCGLMGLAFVATACSGDKPCAINEDGGLILGIVTAHEMGHVMGCSHDQEDVSGCQPQAEDKSFYVMSPFVHLHTNIWSNCSRGFITALFDNDLGECLNDEPQVSLFEDKNMLPGTIYDAKYQCQMEYPGSSVCEGTPERFCRRLLCKTEPDRCKTNGEPPADGTKCGDNKWCYDTKCVEIGERPAAINGGWSDWGSYTDCSRTCGGGVSYSSRDCNNPKPQHKGRYCMGERKRVKICNVRKGFPPFELCSAPSMTKSRFRISLPPGNPSERI
ncbi:PREDICTED: A disintegrin and metalloproteinase with thrombospondin motifs 12-like, partial [Nicrophorus vespilloides]|uniref:A disintegrin and metalloproteinase with thrombospondin motifs 12-like n=1 Tax=Nicrophorus vespilloides TaxID=110193 RepID=A0ABM1MX10_NICVS